MIYQRQDDFGTPESRSEEQMTLTIDGRQVTVPAAPA
jgi:formate dehydrogenase major subunit